MTEMSETAPDKDAPRGAPAPKIGLVSLGCPKALVDSERIVTRLRAEGYELSPDYAGADAVVVNTCGFLNSAKEESLQAIGEALAENGRVIVTGCLGVEAGRIRDQYPDVLAITGPQAYEAVVEAVHKAVPRAHDPFLDLVPPQGVRFTPRHYAYLKISEGCNHSCSFCIIPHLRGPLRSRPFTDVMREAERLVDAGVQELLVISQDTSAYGVDLSYAETEWKGRQVQTRFADLAAALGSLGVWVRMHYVYPYPHVDQILPLMAEGRILPYLDIPFQHASPRILKSMRRPAHQEKTLERLARWREQCPDLAVRSTFIVGFPGETEDDFVQLLDWLSEARLARVGCFKYEDVDGAPANALTGQVPEEVKEERYARLMAHQQAISAEVLGARVGEELEVIVDDVDAEGAIARSHWDAPEIDGNVFIDDCEGLEAGDRLLAKVTDASEYDLWASPLHQPAGTAA
ncbi:30S ribosomal protein S12 methylthiotransferase RimO [Methyloceanibacter caenitepidi]|uniref:Ribosomal protein uS12 methylthiotransferase RimO n=1 Tax=Methyloceanibacter caenitepidi TaxID=1384459 RepID=A0A0A8K054_9HYPH|nr:30S ribosomal protein S12 methylthiotransferase RimO [Methyloceanibacter caenitepidi]BAQ16191.1 ribosomal protein S12p Asp88 (E. coli) methylthiotransferase [Methyloceanibacter caenitepidi]